MRSSGVYGDISLKASSNDLAIKSYLVLYILLVNWMGSPYFDTGIRYLLHLDPNSTKRWE